MGFTTLHTTRDATQFRDAWAPHTALSSLFSPSLAACLPIAKRPNLALHFASIGHPASGCCMPPPEQPVPDNVSAPPSLDKPLDSAAVSATVRRQRLAEAAAAMSHADEPPLAHQGVRFTEDGTSPRPVRVVGLDALRNGELRGSQALVDEDVSPCSRVSSGEVSAGSAASPFRNARRLRPTVAHRSPPEPAAAGTSPSSFFTRFGELRAPRSTLAMAVLTMAILAMGCAYYGYTCYGCAYFGNTCYGAAATRPPHTARAAGRGEASQQAYSGMYSGRHVSFVGARRPLVVDILRGDAVEGIARRHSNPNPSPNP